MNILQLNAHDESGGAARISWYLYKNIKNTIHGSYYVVGYKTSNDPNINKLPNDKHRNPWVKSWRKIGESSIGNKFGFTQNRINKLALLGEPIRLLNRQRGIEDFDYPGTKSVFRIFKQKIDIIHAHVLHSGYFDLRQLPEISNNTPTIITCHDEWLMTGHCACTFGSERWKFGCIKCPDLESYPSIKRDSASFNWQRKKEIYSKSKLYIVTPSQWLMDRVNQSILKPAILGKKVIPNGIDTNIFYPGSKTKARQILGLPIDSWISLFVGHNTISNKFKDFKTVKKAVIKFEKKTKIPTNLLVCLGEKNKDEKINNTIIKYLGYEKDLRKVAEYYRASDIYLHSTKADTFPNSILEAFGCKTPVIATDVGGIPEQINDGVTGYLVPAKSYSLIADRMKLVYENITIGKIISENALSQVKKRFNLNSMIKNYIYLYEEIVKNCNGSI